MIKTSDIQRCINDYSGGGITVIEVLPDPNISYSYVVLTDHEGWGYIVHDKGGGKIEVWDEFLIDPGKTLQDLTTGPPSLLNMVMTIY